MKPYISLFILSLAVTQFAGCKKDNSFLNARPNTIITNVGGYELSGEKYRQFDNGSDGIFDISITHIPYSTGDKFASMFQGSINSPKTNNLQCGGIISLNNSPFNCSENSYMQKVSNANDIIEYFGKKINFSLSGNENIKPFSTNVESPLQVQILNPKKNIGFDVTYFQKNQTIFWNADKSNFNGVLIVVDWNGTTLSNLNAQNSVLNYNIVPDDGSEILSDAYFKNIPDNAVVTIKLIRGNFEYFTNTDGIKYQLIARSESDLNCVLGENKR